MGAVLPPLQQEMKMNREILEGWRVQDFIDDLQKQADLIMTGRGLRGPFSDRKDLEEWCYENQPCYRKPIPEVTDHFAKRYGLR